MESVNLLKVSRITWILIGIRYTLVFYEKADAIASVQVDGLSPEEMDKLVKIIETHTKFAQSGKLAVINVYLDDLIKKVKAIAKKKEKTDSE